MPTKRKSAFSAALREAQQQHSETVSPLECETVAQQSGEVVEQQYSGTAEHLYSNTVTQSHSKTVKKERKISFYLTSEQESKLYALEIDYYQRIGKRINRNDIVRYLIDQADPDTLIGCLNRYR